MGTAYTDQFLCSYAPRQPCRLRLAPYRQRPRVRPFFGVIRALQEFAEEGLPVRILGFPAFLSHALQHMEDTCVADLQLPAQSLVFLGGGWKNQGSTGDSPASIVCPNQPAIGYRPVSLSGRLRRRRACCALYPVCPPSFSCTCLLEGFRAQPIRFHCPAIRPARLAGIRLSLHFVEPCPCRGHGRYGDIAPRSQLRMRSGDRLV